jgi:hypothetical protein
VARPAPGLAFRMAFPGMAGEMAPGIDSHHRRQCAAISSGD